MQIELNVLARLRLNRRAWPLRVLRQVRMCCRRGDAARTLFYTDLRNEVVFLFQGNRNPLVDHPEWVDCVWLGVCSLPEPLFADSFESAPPVSAGACRRRDNGRWLH